MYRPSTVWTYAGISANGFCAARAPTAYTAIPEISAPTAAAAIGLIVNLLAAPYSKQRAARTQPYMCFVCSHLRPMTAHRVRAADLWGTQPLIKRGRCDNRYRAPMIVRDERDTLLLITQPDHAQLSEAIVAGIRTEPPLDSPARRTILMATREHVNGWTEVDAFPTVDAATGRPCDFMSGPAAVKHELWLRGITRT